MVALFWISLGLLAQGYVGFPLFTLARGCFLHRPLQPDPGAPPPSVSVLISAHNEADGIANKLRSVRSQDYEGAVECIVVSDGSTDETVDAARSVAPAPWLQVLDLDRSGKATALNCGMELATGDIVVFTDANSELAEGALSELVAPFADPDVGGVAGDQRYVGATTDDVGERTYWSFDRMLKDAMSRAGSVTSATGALYAMRRELVPTVVDGVTDDFYISTNAVHQGRRLVFAERAIALEPPAARLGAEYRRKVRVMTRGLRAVWSRRPLLNPTRRPAYSFQLFCHKVLRRISVIPLLLMWTASVGLSRRPRYRLVAVALTAGMAAVGTGTAWTMTGHRSNRFVSMLGYFGMVNVAALHALFNVVTGRRIVRWTPQRPNEGEPGEESS